MSYFRRSAYIVLASFIPAISSAQPVPTTGSAPIHCKLTCTYQRHTEMDGAGAGPVTIVSCNPNAATADACAKAARDQKGSYRAPQGCSYQWVPDCKE
jgi:hypothetical protein